MKVKRRNHIFQYIIKFLGKKVKGTLRKLYIRNKCAQTKIGCIITTIDNKIMIEKGRNNNSILNNFRILNKRT